MCVWHLNDEKYQEHQELKKEARAEKEKNKETEGILFSQWTYNQSSYAQSQLSVLCAITLD
jgi:hypothetical protein